MKTLYGSIGLICAVTLSGCVARYATPPGMQTADLVSHMDNDSSGTTVRGFWTSTTKDPDCKDSVRLQTEMGVGDSFTSAPVKIAAGGRFVVSARYGDARFGQNRICAATAEFAPSAGRSYQVELRVRDNVSNCSIGIYDITAGTKEKVPFELPAHACNDTQRIANGRPLWLNHSYQIQR